LKDATLFFSRDRPSLADVIPVMDDIDSLFTGYERNKKFHRTVRASVTVAKRTLNRYYSLTDGAEVYRIAMMLHPRHRLAYFKSAGWTDEWIKDAKQILQRRFD
ncbi:hypothetical protein FB45DRAFT_673918, partial [Roridomyces roridus]